MIKNTKQSSRYWCLTIWDISLNPEETKKIFYDNTDKIKYMVFQLEKADSTKREHYQAYIELNRTQRMSCIKKLFGKTVHCEIKGGTRKQARYYCMKNYVGIYNDEYQWEGHHGREWGDIYHECGVFGKGQGERTDILECKKLIDEGKTMSEIANECFVPYIKYHRGLEKYQNLILKKTTKEFRSVSVSVYWGQAGSGKSREALYNDDNSRKDDIYILEQRGNTVWFDGYEGEKTLVINDFYGWIKYGYLLNILDGHQQQLEIKGGITYANWDKVVITSNKHPREWYERGYTTALKRRIGTIKNFVPKLVGNTGDTSAQNEFVACPSTNFNQVLIDELRWELDEE